MKKAFFVALVMSVALGILSTTSYAITGDGNGDGRPDVQEVDNTVDLNNDGTPDNFQLGVIKSVQATIGTTPVQVGLEAFSNVSAISTIELVDPAILPQSPVNLPQGVVGFTVAVASPGATAEILLHYAATIEAVTSIYMHDAGNGWGDFTLTGQMAINPDRKMISYMITDGGAGDDDGTANGLITNLVAPAEDGPYLLKDINSDGSTTSSYPYGFVEMNGFVYFRAMKQAENGSSGYELWKSDGTPAGSMLVKDINPGSISSFPDNLLNMNGILYFTANDGVSGTELWKSDGTEAGTVMVRDIIPGLSSSSPAYLTNGNGVLFFSANGEGKSVELWKSDGTEMGTVLVKDINPSSYSSPKNLTNINGTLFFSANDGTNGIELWKSDGTEGGTVLVKDIRFGSLSSSPSYLIDFGGTLFFSANDGTNGIELWKSDGTEGGTVLVKDIRSGSLSSSPVGLTDVGGALFFSAGDGTTNGYELWKSDGTWAGTVMVKDINPGSNSSTPDNLININGTLFFTADDGVNYRELWTSDGTPSGTVLVKDISPIFGGAPFPENLTDVGGTLYFSAYEGTNGTGLWKSDGTVAGTVLVKGIGSGEMIDFNGTLIFLGIDGVTGSELWKSDGTEAGTVLIRDINIGSVSFEPGPIFNINGTLYINARDQTHGYEWWKSDRTLAGTVLFKDINPGPGGGAGSELVNINGTLFFQGDDGNDHGYELWKSDGTEVGTVMVKDIFPGWGSSFLGNLTDVNGTLFFTAYSGISNSTNNELWKSDGTEAGTVMVKDIVLGEFGSSPSKLTNVNGSLFFTAYDGSNGTELWKSDGTEAGTVMVKDILPGSGSSSPEYLTNVNGTLFFTADDGVNNRELWKSDGTSAGTVMVPVEEIPGGAAGSWPSDLVNFNGTLFFMANGGASGYELWKSDGTAAGTVLVKDINPGKSSASPARLTDVEGTLFFTADDGTGYGLWKSDGTEAGTVFVSEAGGDSMTNVAGTLCFRTSDGIHGIELWKSDGTAAGTVMVKDIYPGPLDGLVTNLTVMSVVDRFLYFTARDVTHGDNELWAYDTNHRPTFTVVPTIINSPYVGRTLTLYSETEDLDGDSPALSYRWQADGVDIGTDQQTYILTASEIGKTVTCTITADDGFGGVNRLTASAGVVMADPDTDGDGRIDNQEVAATTDLNNDSIDDNDQLGKIKSVQADIGGTPIQAGLEIGGSTNVTAITMIELVDPAVLPAAPVNLPAGLLSFTVDLNAPGATAEMVIFYGDPLPVTITTLYKFDAANGWVDFTSTGGMTISADRKKVTYYITDGGPGDADAAINGVIVDPIGLGEAIDADGDGVPDSSDVCPGFDDNLDADGDTVPDGCDICAGSDDTQDADTDGVPDGCDICAGGNDNSDLDGDSVPDGCDACSNTMPIRIAGGSNHWLGLQWVYDNSVQSGQTVQAQSSYVYGPLWLDQGIDVTIQGGFDCSYLNNSGVPTFIESLTIDYQSGSVTLDNVAIK